MAVLAPTAPLSPDAPPPAPSSATRTSLLPRLAAACFSESHRSKDNPFFDGTIDDGLAAVAGAEDLLPRLGERLAAGALRARPALAATLTTAHRVCVARTLVMDHAVRAASRTLAARGIPALCLKGAALIRGVLPPGSRSMADVDLLVPAARWHEATERLLESGARIHDLYERPFTAKHDYAVPLLLREGVVVELHRYLCERPAFTPPYDGANGLFTHARAHPDGVLVPDPEDLFLGLAVHAAHHGLCLPFRAVVDGVALGRSGSLRPAVVVARAEAWNARRATAAFIAILLRFGLPPGPFRPLLAPLGFGPDLAALTNDAPWPEATAVSTPELLARRMALLDSTGRRVAFVAQRLALRLGDEAVRRLGLR